MSFCLLSDALRVVLNEICYHRVLIMTGCWTWSLLTLFPTSLNKGIEARFPSRLSQLQPEFFSILRVFCACRDWYPALLMESKWLNEPNMQNQLNNPGCCSSTTWCQAQGPGLELDHGFTSVWPYLAGFHPLRERPYSEHSQRLMRSSVQSKNPFLELMVPQSLTLVIWGWLTVQPLSSLTFLIQLEGSGRTLDHFAFHLALAHLK